MFVSLSVSSRIDAPCGGTTRCWDQRQLAYQGIDLVPGRSVSLLLSWLSSVLSHSVSHQVWTPSESHGTHKHRGGAIDCTSAPPCSSPWTPQPPVCASFSLSDSLCLSLSVSQSLLLSEAGQQGWRALYQADVERRKAEQDAKDLARQQEEMEAAAYVQAEAQAKWSIRAELAARERRARGAEETADQEAAAHLLYKCRAEELEDQTAKLKAQLATVLEAKEVAETQLAETTKEAEKVRTKNAALVKSANPLAEQQKQQAAALKDQTAEVERLRATIKHQRDKASKNREKLEIDLHCSRIRERELAVQVTALTAETEELRDRVGSLEAKAEAHAVLSEKRETELKQTISSLEAKIAEANRREHKTLADWAEVLGAALHSSMEALAIPQFKELVPLTVDTMQTCAPRPPPTHPPPASPHIHAPNPVRSLSPMRAALPGTSG